MNFLSATARIIFRLIFEAVHRLVINIFDTLFGFLNWPQKKIRIKVFILQRQQDDPILLPADLNAAIDHAKISFKKNFNVKLLPYNHEQFVEVLQTVPPKEILYTKGGAGAMKEEFKIAGSFFASNLSAAFYPVTAFVVADIVGAHGCSLGPFTDYITFDPGGAKNSSILAHELAHACGLWHVKGEANLLYPNKKRGDEIKWWQKSFFRSSRHVTYW